MTIIKTSKGEEIKIEDLPNLCPFCHKYVEPKAIIANRINSIAELLFKCPNEKCNKFFIGYYINSGSSAIWTFSNQTSLGNIIEEKFTEVICNISNSFSIIYNQAYTAEQHQLNEICGVGYRKACEFLIKDYIIKNNPNSKNEIEDIPLGVCIKKYVTDDKIKEAATRVIWLGNDETHYKRKWEKKDLSDLKALISLTIHWIEMEELSKKILLEMPN